jgi:hypothetical protein
LRLWLVPPLSCKLQWIVMFVEAVHPFTVEANARAAQRLRGFIVAAGLAIALLFPIVGLATELQMFGDGSIFSYAVAAEQAWTFHWHNISGRLFSYVFAYIPAETWVGLTDDAKGGILIYGLLRFLAPLLGLIATFAADRTRGRVIFAYACLSTACLCPLVFGAPTEMWMAHALFWPTLAVCLGASVAPRGVGAMFAMFLLLVLTHEGAVVLSLAVLAAVFLYGRRDGNLAYAIVAWSGAMLIWLGVKIAIAPDDYIAGVIAGHALMFIDPRNFLQPAFLLLGAALLAYTVTAGLIQRVDPNRAPLFAAIACVAALAGYWLWFDTSLLAEARYELRTALLAGTPALGLVATLQAAAKDQGGRFPPLRGATTLLESRLHPDLLLGALLLVMLVHAVETAKFVHGWLQYKTELRALTAGTASDPSLGDPLFVSSARLGPGLNRLAWNSTTPYLSVLVAPGMQPARLVVDPTTTYFWLSCKTAKHSEEVSTALPAGARGLIRRYSCLHR